MKTRHIFSGFVCGLAVLTCGWIGAPLTASASENSGLLVGVAVRDISPELPIRLAGYAGRKRGADKLDNALVVQALAFKNPTGERFVLVSLDNCEVSRAFMNPVVTELEQKHRLKRGEVAVVSSHTHSAPVLEDTLADMSQPSVEERAAIRKYSQLLRARLVEVVGAALEDCRPALLEQGKGRAGIAMNRRVYRGDSVVFGDNPEGPVDWDVPVLRIRGTNGTVRAVVFGYACHGTTVRSGDDWYCVSGEYMSYAREMLEKCEPGAVALFLTGMGADSDPSPRGDLMQARRHGLELAGAVMGVLNRPMRPVRGTFKLAYDELDLPLVKPPTHEQLELDLASRDVHVMSRAARYVELTRDGKPVPETVKLPVAAVRLGNDLTLVLMGGEVVVDYSRRLKRLLGPESVWTVGYAYEVPCYIPSARLIKEGGYETESSMIYYGYYGPFRTSIEDQLVNRVESLVTGLK